MYELKSQFSDEESEEDLALKVYNEAISLIATLSDVKEVEPLMFRLTSNWRRQQKAKRCCAKKKLMKPAKLFVALLQQMPVKSY